MGYPSDIIHLVFNYLIKPSYILDGPLAKSLGISVNRATTNPVILAQLAKNPRALGRNFPTKSYLIMDLAENPSPELNEIIWNYPIECVANNSEELRASFIKKLSCNPHTKPTIDTLFEIYPDIISKDTLTGYGFGDKFALSTQIFNKFGNDARCGSHLCNPSDELVDIFITNTIPRPEMLSNPNSKAIEHGISSPYIAHMVNAKFSYSRLPENEKGWLFTVFKNLLGNNSEVAKKYVNQILGNIMDDNIDELIKKILEKSYTIYFNPADWVVDFLEKYLGIFYESSTYMGMLSHNTNPRACNLFFNLLRGKLIREEQILFAANPGAIDIIRTHPEMFKGIPEIYSNPEIFKLRMDKRLIKKLEHLFFI